MKKTMMKSIMRRIKVKYQEIRSSTTPTNQGDKIDQLMQKMTAKREELAKDRKRMNMTKDEYAIFRKQYLDARKQSDQVVDEDNPLRLKNMYLRQFDEYEEAYEDCNEFEIAELKKRKQFTTWLYEDDLIKKLIQEAA